VAPRMDGPAFGDVATLTPFLPTALPLQPATPVFTDETGRRAEVLQWAGRGFCLMGAVLCAALAVTMQTRILLPSLEKALLGSSEGLTPVRTGVSHTLRKDAVPRTDLRGGSDQNRVVGQRVQLAEPTLDSAATEARQVDEIPITEQHAQRATGTSATGGSDSQPVAWSPTPSASPPTTGAGHRSSRAGAVREPGAGKAKGSTVAKSHQPSAATKTRNPHAVPKLRNPRAATPSSGRQAHSPH
jgi:hypothetical protein